MNRSKRIDAINRLPAEFRLMARGLMLREIENLRLALNEYRERIVTGSLEAAEKFGLKFDPKLIAALAEAAEPTAEPLSTQILREAMQRREAQDAAEVSLTPEELARMRGARILQTEAELKAELDVLEEEERINNLPFEPTALILADLDAARARVAKTAERIARNRRGARQ